MARNSRFTLDMPPQLHMKLKIIATIKGATMRDYCLSAIEAQLARDRAQIADVSTLTALKQTNALKDPDVNRGQPPIKKVQRGGRQAK